MRTLLRIESRILSKLDYGAILLIVSFLYLIGIPMFAVYMLIVLCPFASRFFHDYRNRSRIFTASLPFSRSQIVRSRYLLAFLEITAMLAWLFVLGHLVQWAGRSIQFVMNGSDFLVFLCMAIVLLAVSLPFYYLFPSYIPAVLSTIAIIFAAIYYTLVLLVKVLGLEGADVIVFNDMDPGVVRAVQTYLPLAPYFALILGTALLFVLSIKLSELLYRKKDI